MVKAFTELFKLSDADLFTSGGFQRTPRLLEFGTVGLG